MNLSKTLMCSPPFKTHSVMLLALLLLVCSAGGQDALDGPNHIFQDTLLDRLTGSWRLTGTMLPGTPYEQKLTHDVQVQWTLNHQFLQIHEKATESAAKNTVPYEAIVMIGYDNTSERYVAHWMDVYGGRFSEALGYGKRSGAEIEFAFEYPDGPFHTTFSWKTASGEWKWLMRRKNKDGAWVTFGEMSLVPATVHTNQH